MNSFLLELPCDPNNRNWQDFKSTESKKISPNHIDLVQLNFIHRLLVRAFGRGAIAVSERTVKFQSIGTKLRNQLFEILDALGPPIVLEPITLLHFAAVSKDLSKFASLVESGEIEDINALSLKDPNWHPLLWLLSQTDRDQPTKKLQLPRRLKKVLHLMLCQGISVHCSNAKGYTPLHTFVRISWNDDSQLHKQIYTLMLSQGADINAESLSGETPLHLATLDSIIDSVEFLLALGADPNIANRRGDIALHYIFHRQPAASQDDLTTMFRLLLLYGSNPKLEGTLHKDCHALVSELPEPRQTTYSKLLEDYNNGFLRKPKFTSFSTSRTIPLPVQTGHRITPLLKQLAQELPQIKQQQTWLELMTAVHAVESKLTSEPESTPSKSRRNITLAKTLDEDR